MLITSLLADSLSFCFMLNITILIELFRKYFWKEASCLSYSSANLSNMIICVLEILDKKAYKNVATLNYSSVFLGFSDSISLSMKQYSQPQNVDMQPQNYDQIFVFSQQIDLQLKSFCQSIKLFMKVVLPDYYEPQTTIYQFCLLYTSPSPRDQA
eukprot:TRINITY_DN16737_c0_g1_i1.p2 TRINITY_DN16737_c0_g1~~TRINITY_DN16737_c0_g1_i1.p2  ORF type:complete len:155 (-),score=12.25 TRINITY_DN16737_c0_g1_i1:95-559(-)